MLINSSDIYINDLFSLWKEAFGDEDGYINLFFDTVYKNNVKVFAALDNCRIVSALYLMPSYIIDGGVSYKGYYLYAAATLKDCRGKGLMAKLINEAKTYASEQKKTYISLVPGEEYLYSYYSKFGFEALMYRCKDTLKGLGKSDDIDNFSVGLCDYFKSRKALISVASHHLSDEAYSYASKCYEYLGVKSFGTDSGKFIYDSENKCIKELLSQDTRILTEKLQDDLYTVYSPYGKEKEKYGMVWFADDSVKIDEIYMNIALD